MHDRVGEGLKKCKISPFLSHQSPKNNSSDQREASSWDQTGRLRSKNTLKSRQELVKAAPFATDSKRGEPGIYMDGEESRGSNAPPSESEMGIRRSQGMEEGLPEEWFSSCEYIGKVAWRLVGAGALMLFFFC